MIKYRKAIENLSAYVPGKPVEEVQKEFGLKTVTKLASNESQWGASPKALEAAKEALNEITVYPDGNSTSLKNAISEKLGIPQSKIIMGCGTDEVIFMIGKAFIDEGDECITGDVTFSQYAASVESMGGKMVYVPLKNHTFDLDGILNKITDKTKMIFIANPNNPTGTYFTGAQQEEFIKKAPSDVLVIFDEAYAEFVEDPSYPATLQMMDRYKNVMLLKTFSKAYGLASLRVGYGIAEEWIIELLNRIRGPFNVNIPAQRAAEAAIRDEEHLKMAVRNNAEARAYLSQRLDEMGISYIPSAANFIMVDVEENADAVFRELLKEGCIVRSGKPFGMDTYIRVSTGNMAQMEDFAQKLKKVKGGGLK